MNKHNTAKMQMLLAMAIFGTIGVFIKNIALPSAEIALWRSVVAFIMLTLIVTATGKIHYIKISGRRFWLLFGSGAALGFNWLLLFEAYRYTSVAVSSLCNNFAPTLVVIGSLLIFREKLTIKQTVCFIASTLGLVLVISVSGGGSNDTIGALYGLGAALLYAAVVLFNKALGDIDGMIRTWLQLGASMFVLLPYVALTCDFHVTELDMRGLWLLLIICVVHTGLNYCLYFSALSKLRGQQAAILSYTEPVVSVTTSFFILGESITVLQLTGGIMIIGFALLNEMDWSKPKQST